MEDKGDRASTASGEEPGARTIEAMLALAGELGYRDTTVAAVTERSGGTIAGFYESFSGREACFAAGHEIEIERLYSALTEAAAEQPSWREGLRAALLELFGFVAERPLIARAILSEVYVVGGPALIKHEEILERFSRALEGACQETAEPRHSPPPLTAPFMVGAIEESVRALLAVREPERLAASLPKLMHLLVGPYLGDEAAGDELKGGPAGHP